MKNTITDYLPNTRKGLALAMHMTDRQMRNAVREARRAGIPIVSDNGIYRIAETENDVETLCRALESRALDMLSTAKKLKQAPIHGQESL